MKLSDIAKRMIIIIIGITILCILASVVYYRSLDFLPFLYGVLLGSAVSIAKVLLLERAVNKALTMEKKRAGAYVSMQHLFRLLISGIALALGAIIPQIHLWGVVAGILAFHVAIYCHKLKLKR